MSIANMHFDNKKIKVYWDTLGYEPETGHYCRIPKAHVLPHIRTIFASQGSTLFNFNAAINLSIVKSADNSIDAIMPDLVQRIEAAEDVALPFMAAVQGHTNVRCYLAGWSNQLRKPVVMELNAQDGDPERFKPQIYASKKGESQRWHCINVCFEHRNYSKAEFIKVAELQRIKGREGSGYQLVGGELICTTITETTIDSKVVHVWHEDRRLLGQPALELVA